MQVYNNWITPLQKQLEKIQSGFEELLKLHKLDSLSKCEPESSTSVPLSPEISISTTQQQSPLSKSELDLTQEAELKDAHQQGKCSIIEEYCITSILRPACMHKLPFYVLFSKWPIILLTILIQYMVNEIGFILYVNRFLPWI